MNLRAIAFVRRAAGGVGKQHVRPDGIAAEPWRGAGRPGNYPLRSSSSSSSRSSVVTISSSGSSDNSASGDEDAEAVDEEEEEGEEAASSPRGGIK